MQNGQAWRMMITGEKKMAFKLLDPVLWANIKSQVDGDFGIGVTKELVGDLVPISLEKESVMSIYLSSMDWIGIIEQGLGSYELYSLGSFFGEIAKGKFKLSVSVLNQIVPLTNSQIVISGKGAGPFTYGKSILKESVIEAREDLKKGQRIIVLNENHDCLGLATMTTDGYTVGKMRPDDLVAKNRADIGLYIRRFF